ncbi:DUF3268 family zinc-finger domain-containing protein [Levilactobacillus yiduensis]|uniref:DUF3268 family zinc-finger domain-containing protein n=1 Tax=Levilactobacillus yiduensis TaxID=2953880 RepID=UPI002157C2F3|nr:DUF3268 family zinc-finger domain-containing protein [Levilactobacillus yiduensis]
MESLKHKPEQWDKHPCPYCGGKVVYASNANIYGGREFGNGRCYFCLNCQASVGVYSDGASKHPTRMPLGILATPEMKELKMLCHSRFDKVWRSHWLSRSRCYKRMAHLMGIDLDYCHFGYFNEDDLMRALTIMETNDWYMEESNEN